MARPFVRKTWLTPMTYVRDPQGLELALTVKQRTAMRARRHTQELQAHTWMKAKVAAPVLAPPDMAAVSAAVCLSREAPICSASPPAVPCHGITGSRALQLHHMARSHCSKG